MEERARARAAKQREEEKKYILAQEKCERDVEAINANARKVEEKIKDARQLAREATKRRFAAMEREKLAEERSKPVWKPAAKAAPAGPKPPALRKGEVALSLVCKHCGKRFGSETQASAHADKSGHQNFAKIMAGPVKPPVKSAVKPNPTSLPVNKATPATKPAPAKASEKKSLPTRPAPKSAPQPRAPARAPSSPPLPTRSEKEKLTPCERVRLTMARREAAIRALPAEELGDSELDLSITNA